MKRTVLAVSLLAILASASSAMAYSSSMGPTGGAGLPNADVVGQGKFELTHDVQNAHGNEETETSSDNTHLLYGITKDTEIGLVYDSAKSVDHTTGAHHTQGTWGINAKKSFAQKNGLKTAIGVTYRRSIDNDLSRSYGMHYYSYGLYGAASRVLKKASSGVEVIGTLGAYYGAGRASYNVHGVKESVNASSFRPYTSLDFEFHNGATLTAEYEPQVNDYGAVSTFALHCPVRKNVSVKAETNSFNHQPIYGIDYSFSK
ncbi:MAG: hypothetical protein NT018_03970 [Armatimonadetes bacterium]|nr:hypothetical protein [Armatimonadota bacterium]